MATNWAWARSGSTYGGAAIAGVVRFGHDAQFCRANSPSVDGIPSIRGPLTAIAVRLMVRDKAAAMSILAGTQAQTFVGKYTDDAGVSKICTILRVSWESVAASECMEPGSSGSTNGWELSGFVSINADTLATLIVDAPGA